MSVVRVVVDAFKVPFDDAVQDLHTFDTIWWGPMRPLMLTCHFRSIASRNQLNWGSHPQIVKSSP